MLKQLLTTVGTATAIAALAVAGHAQDKTAAAPKPAVEKPVAPSDGSALPPGAQEE